MNQPCLPDGLEHVRTTDTFDNDTVPAGLLRAHRVQGVLHQVDEHLLELDPPPQHQRPRRDLGEQLGPPPQAVPQHAQGAVHHLVDRDELGGGLGVPREELDVADELGDAAGPHRDRPDQLAELGVGALGHWV